MTVIKNLPLSAFSLASEVISSTMSDARDIVDEIISEANEKADYGF